MALAGFRTWTDSGVFQIDSSYDQYSIIKKTKVYCNSTPSGFTVGYGIGQTKITSNAPIIVAVKGANSNPVTILAINQSGNDYTIIVSSSVNTYVEVYIYTYYIPQKTKAGMNIYNEEGRLVFSSAVPPLIITKLYNHYADGYKNETISVADNPPSNYAVVIPPPVIGKVYFGLGATYEFWEAYFYTVNSTGYYSQKAVYKQLAAPVARLSYDSGLFGTVMLVDVSNINSFDWS